MNFGADGGLGDIAPSGGERILQHCFVDPLARNLVLACSMHAETDMIAQVEGIYAWPYDGPWALSSTALVVVDMQRDFLEPDGWLALTGGATAPLAAILPAVGRALDAARRAGPFVTFTVEAYRGDLADLPANRLWRSERLGHAIGAMGPLGRHLVHGTDGAAIIDPLAPSIGEPIVAKPGKSAFIALQPLQRGAEVFGGSNDGVKILLGEDARRNILPLWRRTHLICPFDCRTKEPNKGGLVRVGHASDPRNLAQTAVSGVVHCLGLNG
jgi:hypothetical protein